MIVMTSMRKIENQREVERLNVHCKCPDCNSKLFQLGPQGGMAINIRCAKCKSCFWFAPPFTPERIQDVGDWAYGAPVNLYDWEHGLQS